MKKSNAQAIILFIIFIISVFITGCTGDMILIRAGNSTGGSYVSGSNETLIDASECLTPPCGTFLDVMT